MLVEDATLVLAIAAPPMEKLNATAAAAATLAMVTRRARLIAKKARPVAATTLPNIPW